MKCRRCGESLDWLMAQALMVDLGARVYPSPLQCGAGGEHDFIPHTLDDTISEEYHTSNSKGNFPGKNMGD